MSRRKILSLPGVRALVVASHAMMPGNAESFANYVSKTENQPDMKKRAKKRTQSMLTAYCKVVVASQELESLLSNSGVPAPASPKEPSETPATPAWPEEWPAAPEGTLASISAHHTQFADGIYVEQPAATAMPQQPAVYGFLKALRDVPTCVAYLRQAVAALGKLFGLSEGQQSWIVLSLMFAPQLWARLFFSTARSVASTTLSEAAQTAQDTAKEAAEIVGAAVEQMEQQVFGGPALPGNVSSGSAAAMAGFTMLCGWKLR